MPSYKVSEVEKERSLAYKDVLTYQIAFVKFIKPVEVSIAENFIELEISNVAVNIAGTSTLYPHVIVLEIILNL